MSFLAAIILRTMVLEGLKLLFLSIKLFALHAAFYADTGKAIIFELWVLENGLSKI